MTKQYVMGIRLTNRVQNAGEFQKVLTECGCYIKTRLGLHEANDTICSPNGLIILELFGGDEAILAMEKKFRSIEGLQVQKMVFEV